MENKENLCEAEVKKNLVLVELGKPLTLPLAKLNKSCHFRREWMNIQTKWHGITKGRREHSQLPEVKAKLKARSQLPENKAKRKAYSELPEVKEKTRARVRVYYQLPEVKARYKAKRKLRYEESKNGSHT